MWMERKSVKTLLHMDSRWNWLINCYIKVLTNMSKVIPKIFHWLYWVYFTWNKTTQLQYTSQWILTNVYIQSCISPPERKLPCTLFAVTGNRWFTFCHSVFPFHEFYIRRLIVVYVSFSNIQLFRFHIVASINSSLLFTVEHYIPLNAYTTICLSTHLWMDMWVVSSFGYYEQNYYKH